MKNKTLFLIGIMLLLWHCSSPIAPVEKVANVILVEMSEGESSLGSACYVGTVQNIGAATAFNCQVKLELYEDAAKTKLLETMTAWGDGLAEIQPNEGTGFEASPCYFSIERVKAYEIFITWD